MPRANPGEYGSLERWFYDHYDYPTPLAPFQQRILKRLEQLERRDGKRRLLCAMPPGHSKTSLGVHVFVPWYLAHNSGHSVLITSYDDPIAREFGADVLKICKRLSSDVPGLAPVREKAAASHFSTALGNTVYAAGFNGPISGRRVDCVIVDDPVKNHAEADSEADMAKRYKIYASAVKPRRKPGGIILANLTRWGMRDWWARVEDAEGKYWDQLLLPAEEPPDSGEYLWSSYIERETYEEAKADPEFWWTVWQQQPKQLFTHVFREEWLRFWDASGDRRPVAS